MKIFQPNEDTKIDMHIIQLIAGELINRNVGRRIILNGELVDKYDDTPYLSYRFDSRTIEFNTTSVGALFPLYIPTSALYKIDLKVVDYVFANRKKISKVDKACDQHSQRITYILKHNIRTVVHIHENTTDPSFNDHYVISIPSETRIFNRDTDDQESLMTFSINGSAIIYHPKVELHTILHSAIMLQCYDFLSQATSSFPNLLNPTKLQALMPCAWTTLRVPPNNSEMINWILSSFTIRYLDVMKRTIRLFPIESDNDQEHNIAHLFNVIHALVLDTTNSIDIASNEQYSRQYKSPCNIIHHPDGIVEYETYVLLHTHWTHYQNSSISRDLLLSVSNALTPTSIPLDKLTPTDENTFTLMVPPYEACQYKDNTYPLYVLHGMGINACDDDRKEIVPINYPFGPKDKVQTPKVMFADREPLKSIFTHRMHRLITENKTEYMDKILQPSPSREYISINKSKLVKGDLSTLYILPVAVACYDGSQQLRDDICTLCGKYLMGLNYVVSMPFNAMWSQYSYAFCPQCIHYSTLYISSWFNLIQVVDFPNNMVDFITNSGIFHPTSHKILLWRAQQYHMEKLLQNDKGDVDKGDVDKGDVDKGDVDKGDECVGMRSMESELIFRGYFAVDDTVAVYAGYPKSESLPFLCNDDLNRNMHKYKKIIYVRLMTLCNY